VSAPSPGGPRLPSFAGLERVRDVLVDRVAGRRRVVLSSRCPSSAAVG
jgi:hypothetical protein